MTESSLGITARIILRRYAASYYRQKRNPFEIANPPLGPSDPRLAGTVVQFYLENMQMAAGTGAALGIPTFFYWQPALAAKNPRSAFEDRLAAESERQMPGRMRFVRQTYDQLHAAVTTPGYRGPRITDLRTLLNSQPSCFADLAHIIEGCNAVIASRIAADAIPILRELNARDRMPRWAQSPGR